MNRLGLILIGVVFAAALTLGLWPSVPVFIRNDAADIIDIHVHAACMDTRKNGCFISSAISESYKYPFYLRAFGVNEEELRREGDMLVLRRLDQQIAESRAVNKAVVVALDGVIVNGQLSRELTQVYVPNEYLARELPNYPNLLFGASINPYRPDALHRLQKARRSGAVLVKWIPGIMHIDPADEKLIPFYDELARLGLVLLSHTGQERAFASSRDELNDPRRLGLPLRRGVTVIAAHVASTGQNEGEEDFLRLLPMFEEHENLYADISSLTQINKLGYLKRALAFSFTHDRLVYGSDWPLQFFPLVSPWYQVKDVPVASLKAISALKNTWDRDVALKRAMGTPESVFTRTGTLLKLE